MMECDHNDRTWGPSVLGIWGAGFTGTASVGSQRQWVDGAQPLGWVGGLPHHRQGYPGRIQGPSSQVSGEGWMLKSLTAEA